MGCTSDFKSNDPQTVCDFVSISENENLYAVYGALPLAFIPMPLVAPVTIADLPLRVDPILSILNWSSLALVSTAAKQI